MSHWAILHVATAVSSPCCCVSSVVTTLLCIVTMLLCVVPTLLLYVVTTLLCRHHATVCRHHAAAMCRQNSSCVAFDFNGMSTQPSTQRCFLHLDAANLRNRSYVSPSVDQYVREPCQVTASTPAPIGEFSQRRFIDVHAKRSSELLTYLHIRRYVGLFQ